MSDGVQAVRTALVADGTLTGLVPAARIIGDDALPKDVTYPAITLSSVSRVDRNIPNPLTGRHVVERIQVTIFAASRPSRKAVLDAVRHAAGDKMPTVTGISAVTIHTDGAGPDFLGEGDVRITTQDLRVTYTQTR